MKLAVLMLTIGFVMVGNASAIAADEVKPNTADSAVQAITGKEKKTRKKKVEMCAECGKPESECECHGKKVDGKKHEHKASQDHGS